MSDLKTVIKAKLFRGSALGIGEIALVLRDMLDLMNKMELQIEATNQELTDLSTRCTERNAESCKTPKV
jgi:hypothetical protein